MTLLVLPLLVALLALAIAGTLGLLAPLWAAIRAARAPRPRTFDDRVILVPRAAGPVVESPDLKYPMPLSRVPIRSEKARDKKAALTYARVLTGDRTLPWKAARKLLNRLDREGRARAAAGAEGGP